MVMYRQVSHGYLSQVSHGNVLSGQSRKCAFRSVTEMCFRVSHGNMPSGQSRKCAFGSVTVMCLQVNHGSVPGGQ